MHQRFAHAAATSEVSRSVGNWYVVEHLGRRRTWRPASEAEEFAGAAALSMALASGFEKGSEFGAMDEGRPPCIDRR